MNEANELHMNKIVNGESKKSKNSKMAERLNADISAMIVIEMTDKLLMSHLNCDIQISILIILRYYGKMVRIKLLFMNEP